MTDGNSKKPGSAGVEEAEMDAGNPAFVWMPYEGGHDADPLMPEKGEDYAGIVRQAQAEEDREKENREKENRPVNVYNPDELNTTRGHLEAVNRAAHSDKFNFVHLVSSGRETPQEKEKRLRDEWFRSQMAVANASYMKFSAQMNRLAEVSRIEREELERRAKLLDRQLRDGIIYLNDGRMFKKDNNGIYRDEAGEAASKEDQEEIDKKAKELRETLTTMDSAIERHKKLEEELKTLPSRAKKENWSEDQIRERTERINNELALIRGSTQDTNSKLGCNGMGLSQQGEGRENNLGKNQNEQQAGQAVNEATNQLSIKAGFSVAMLGNVITTGAMIDDYDDQNSDLDHTAISPT